MEARRFLSQGLKVESMGLEELTEGLRVGSRGRL